MATATEFDFKVADLSLADFGRKEITLAEHEMPGLMAIRREYADAQPLKGARITGSLHMTIQTAVLIETLTALGAEVRWCSCNIFSTQDHAAAAVAIGPEGTVSEPRGVPVYAWKGETLEEYWWCTEQVLRWPTEGEDGSAGPNMILDDGGDATLLVHKGTEYEAAGAVPDPSGADSEEFAVILGLLTRSLGEDPQRWSRIGQGIKGVTEETTTGVHRLYEMVENGELLFPGDQRQRLRHEVEVRQPLRLPPLADRRDQPRDRRDDRRQGRRRVRLRRRRQGLRRIAARPGRARDHHRDRPDLRAAGGDAGLRGETLEDVISSADIFITTTGNKDIITAADMQRMKHQAVVGNIGHFDNEIDIAGLGRVEGIERVNIKPQVDKWVFPDGHAIIMLSEGRLLNLGNATGHPSFVMSNSFSNQTIAQIELFTKNDEYEKRVYVLPKHLDEKVARLHLDALGVKLTKLSREQAAYIGVPVDGPFKPDHYRY